MVEIKHTCLDVDDHDGDCPACALLDAQRAARIDYMRTYTRTHRHNNVAYPPPDIDCPPRPRDGRCDCCLKLPSERGLGKDHDHVTGAFRGWTCHACNAGWNGAGISDNPAELRRRADEFKDPDKARTRADFLDGVLPWQ